MNLYVFSLHARIIRVVSKWYGLLNESELEKQKIVKNWFYNEWLIWTWKQKIVKTDFTMDDWSESHILQDQTPHIDPQSEGL